jgi:hypothetical protein
MKPLEINFTYKGFQYNQEWRDESFAIYSQWLGSELIGYESFKIKKNKAYERFGKFYEASEGFPTSNEWGWFGFTSKTFKEAQEILLEHYPKIPNLVLEQRTETRSSTEAYHNTPQQNLIKVAV